MKEYTVKVFEDGSKCWYLDGQLHREDGPALEREDGSKAWFLDDNYLTEEEHKRRTTKVTDAPLVGASPGLAYVDAVGMDDALAAGDGVILREQAERIAELEEEVERLRAKKKQIYEDLQDAVESEWVQTRMMLAAPDLLEALEGTAALLEQLGFVSDTSLTVGAARAEIAKAKGE